MKIRWRYPIVLTLSVGLAFWPSLYGDFISWDDDKNFLLNPDFRGFSWEHLGWMFTHFHSALYIPVTWMSLAFDFTLWGMNPAGYHAMNLALHAANAVLCYLLAMKLWTRGASEPEISKDPFLRRAAAFAAAFFALHPLRAESVAWVTERRDVLSGFFILISLLCYLYGAEEKQEARIHRQWFVASLGFYFLSLMSKPAGITFPLVLIILDAYLGRKRSLRLWGEKACYLAFALPFAGLAAWGQSDSGASMTLAQLGLSQRAAVGLYGAAFYIRKTLLPLDLSPFYRRPETISLMGRPFLWSAMAVAALTIILFLYRKRWPAPWAAWLCYLVVLAPVSGLFQSGPQLVADRYSYLSCLSCAILAGAGAYKLWNKPRGSALMNTSAWAILAGFSLLTWKQTQLWQDSQKFWSTVVAKDPQNAMALNNLGEAMRTNGHPAEAIAPLTESLRLEPSAEASFNLGAALASLGRWPEAIQNFEIALDGKPNDSKVHSHLALALLNTGKIDLASKHFQEALRLDPANATAHNNLGTIYFSRQKLSQARDEFQKAIDADTAYADAYNNLGAVLASAGHLPEAISAFEKAVQLDPKHPRAPQNLAIARQQLQNHP